MPKREPDPEPIADEQSEPELPSAGERLRSAREKAGLTLEDVAAQTRIPRRHLDSIEKAEWDQLPAPTYTIGFAKSYASAVGLDRIEIADQLREEMGGERLSSATTDVFEPADPRRTMPKGLVIGAVLAVIVIVIVMSWLSRRSLEQPEPAAETPVAQSRANTASAPRQPVPAPAPVVAQGPVVLTASDAVWLQVSERGGRTLFSGTLQPNQTYTVPSTAAAPVLKTGKPEALKVTVGTTAVPPIGKPATTVSNVSLLAADLVKPAPPRSGSVEPSPASGAPPANKTAR